MSGPAHERRRRGWDDDDHLSQREREILALCAEGLSNREIGERLFVGVETVKTHLRNVYGRLGLRNRAQAAAYYLGGPAGDAGSTGESDNAPPLAEQLGIDAAAIESRRALLGLTAGARDRLAPLGDAVRLRSGAFTNRLYERLREHEETARHLEDDAVVERLRAEQRRYLHDLFTAPFDARHVDRMLRVGATHHRIGLAPQWYLATYAPILVEHLDLVFAGASDDADGIESAIVLLSSAFFDAGLVLDAYELSLAAEIASGGTRRAADDTAAPAMGATPPSEEDTVESRRRPLTRVDLTRDEATQRRRFVGLDAATIAEVSRLAPVIHAAVPAVLEAFYSLLADTPTLAGLVPPGTVGRLMDQVASYWAELADTDFGRAHAATRMRVGVIHERIGLSPQLYLAGLASQAAGILRALPGQALDVLGATRALVRALVFDVTFVIDAYIEARGEALLHAGGYAEYLIAGLASGVVVVDARDRIDHANQSLLDLVGVRAGVLRRMPVDRALPFTGVTELLQAARRSLSGRATLVDTCRGRRVRLTAVALRLGAQPAGSPVAVVVDDLSEALRAGERAVEGDHTLDRVLDVVEAIVWEIDADEWTVLTVSRSVMRLTGRTDVEVLGRSFTTLLPQADQAAFVTACAATVHGPQRLRHRLSVGDAPPVEVHSVLVRIVDVDGTPRVCGVSRADGSGS